jgi:hypothetical protein
MFLQKSYEIGQMLLRFAQIPRQHSLVNSAGHGLAVTPTGADKLAAAMLNV